MNNSKTPVAAGLALSSIQFLLGWIFIVFALIGGPANGDIDTADAILMVFFIGSGLWLIVAGIKRRKLIKLFKRYITVLSGDQSNSFATLAEFTKSSEQAVIANLEKMIDRKYFVSAHLDLESRCIVLPNHFVPAPSGVAGQAGSEPGPISGNPAPPAVLNMTTVVCKGCGGVNRVKRGEVGECEYCGSVITGE